MPSAARPMISSASRHAWRSIYESLDFLSSKPFARQNSTVRIGLSQDASFSTMARTWRPASWSVPPSLKPFNNNMRRRLSSSGLLLIGFTPNSGATNSVVATCSAAADSAIVGSTSHTANVGKLARQAWQRSYHTGRYPQIQRRTKTTKSKSTNEGKSVAAERSAGHPEQKHGDPSPRPHDGKSKPATPENESGTVSKYFHLPSLRHMPHRPSKEELLAAANGFWQRLRVRFKWFSIRSMRPWNIDEWGAFVTWFLFGHLVWILVGTTTFVSLLILGINTVVAQESLAKWVGDYLTESAGLTVVFESAIVPRWKDGVISFRNVFVSRRPGQVKSTVSKGSSTDAAAVAAAERGSDKEAQVVEEDDGNYTQFDVTLNTVNVTLSFAKWWSGKGPLKDVEIKGVRGVIDRTSVKWAADPNIDPLSYRHEHQPGDFEIDSFKMEDLLVTIHHPNGFRPFSVSIYSCELPQLRKHYLFYDFLSATHMSGSYDGSLFTIHPRQVHGVPSGRDPLAADPLGGESTVWKKFSRIRIDGLKIDHLNRGVEGPFGWIYEGNVDIVADIRFPADNEDSITKVMNEFYDRLEDAVTSNRYIRILEGTPRPLKSETTIQLVPSGDVPDEADPSMIPADPTSASKAAAHHYAGHTGEEDLPRYLVMDLRIHFNDVKATVPVFTSNLSYVNQALVRPIVAYINAKKTYIPVSCRIVKRATDFDGSWSIYDCGLMDDTSAEMYAAFAHDVEDQQSRVRRLKKVGFWTLSLAVHALFMGMAGNIV